MSVYGQDSEINKFQQFFKTRIQRNDRISNYAIGIHQTYITLSGWFSHCIYSQTSHHAISQSFFVVLLFKITAIK